MAEIVKFGPLAPLFLGQCLKPPFHFHGIDKFAKRARENPAGVLFFVSYQEVPSPPMTSTMTRQCQQAVQLIPPGGQMLSGGGAVLGVLSLLGWKKFSVIFSLLPLSLMVEALYRVIARNRRVFARILFGK